MTRARYTLPLLALLAVFALPQPAQAVTIIKKIGSVWIVPADWNPNNNSIEVYGGGAKGVFSMSSHSGFNDTGSTVADAEDQSLAAGAILADSTGHNDWGGLGQGVGTGDCFSNCGGGGGGAEAGPEGSSIGGGGGAYSRINNVDLTPGTIATYKVGRGSGQSSRSGVSNGDTWLCSSGVDCGDITGSSVLVGAKGAVGAKGGLPAQGVGSVRYRGGNSGNAAGGGAAGPGGAGGNAGYRVGDARGTSIGGRGNGGYAGNGANAGYGNPGNIYGGGGGGGYTQRVFQGGDNLYDWMTYDGGRGAPGVIVITYTPSVVPPPGPPTCTLTVTPSTLPPTGNPQLTWTFNNAYSFYIDGVGAQNPNDETGGPLSVPRPSQTTTYRGAATGAGYPAAICEDTIIVNQPTPPTVTTQPVTNKSSTGATLNGTANPQGSATRAWFRYSTTNPGTCNDTFGLRAPALPNPGVNVGADTIAHDYSRPLTGLRSDETFYYCAIAENAGGKEFGTVRSFSTSDAPCVNPFPGYSCVDDDIWYTNSACVVTKTVCAPPTTCSLGPPPACVYNPIGPSLKLIPDKVQYGHSTTVFWDYPAAESCTITGSNGDSWDTLQGSEESTGIIQRTTYTAVCDDSDADTIEDDFTESKVVTILPFYREI